jgi:restriction endonuclease S subunit
MASKSFRFEEIAKSITERVEDPASAGVSRYVGLEHLDPDSIEIIRWGTPDQVSATKLRFYSGDVVYGRRRAYQRKLGVARFDGICSAHALVLRAKQEVCLPEFLPYFLHSDQFHSRALEISVGSLSPTINWSTLKLQKFVLPSLEEQTRVVELLSAVDEHAEALRHQLNVAGETRKSVLQNLLGKGRKGWAETTLGEVCEVVMGRQLSPSKRLGVRPRPYLRAANVVIGGVNLDDVLEMDFSVDEEKRFSSKVGDVLLVEGGNQKSLGCPALISKREEGLCIQNTIIRCRSVDELRLSSKFLYHSLRFEFWSGKFAELGTGTTIMHLGQKRVFMLPFRLPPLDEQERIVEEITKFDVLIEETSVALNSTKQLRTSLLNKEIA